MCSERRTTPTNWLASNAALMGWNMIEAIVAS
jgi:hypothetical protein